MNPRFHSEQYLHKRCNFVAYHQLITILYYEISFYAVSNLKQVDFSGAQVFSISAAPVPIILQPYSI